MESLDYWRKCEQLSVVQSALLIVGIDPAPKPHAPSWRHEIPDSYHAILAALQGAVLSGGLRATIRSDPRHGVLAVPPDAMAQLQEGGIQHFYRVWPDWRGSLIEVKDLREWLVQRGIESEFFFPDGLPNADYLNPSDLFFSPKLYAAIAAWMAIKADPTLIRGSAKKALTTWLKTNAAQHGLLKEDGEPNTEAIEYIAKVANWDTKGGAPKTPAKPTHPLRKKRR
jgi:hypothetical protein